MSDRLIYGRDDSQPDGRTPKSGEDFYRLYLDGDDSAFAQLIEMYRDNLIFFIDRYVHDLSLAEDIAADCFAELIVHPRRYKFSTSLKTYLFSIARNMAVSFFHRRVREASVPLEDAEETAQYSSFEASILQKEENRLLYNAMDKLPEDYRTVLHLVFFEELTNGQAAKVMKKSTRQIENLLYRAKLSLRKILEKEDSGT